MAPAASDSTAPPRAAVASEPPPSLSAPLLTPLPPPSLSPAPPLSFSLWPMENRRSAPCADIKPGTSASQFCTQS